MMRIGALSSIALLCIVACESSLDPRIAEVDGDYVVALVNGTPPPARLFRDVDGWDVNVLSGRMSIRRGHYEIHMKVRRDDGVSITEIETTDEGWITSGYGQLTMTSDQPGVVSTLTRIDEQTLAVVPELASATVTFQRR